MSEVFLFKSCKGYTDSDAIATQGHDPKTGATQLIGCSNMTVTADGAIEKVPALSTVFTHTAPITRMSAGSRLFFGDGTDIYELSGATAAKRFPILDGPIAHTPLDVRVSGTTKVYKSVNPTGTMTEAVVGTNPDPAISTTYAGMPLFAGGFTYNSRLFVHNGKFLQYSKGYGYDLWDIGNGFIGHQFNVLGAGAVPGVVAVVHLEGVSVYLGGDPQDPQTIKRFYPCAYIDKTLYSGFISKALGYGHVFLCTDGVYMVGQDGAISRLTDSNLEDADNLNSSYRGAIISNGKYLAYGDSLCVEFDFRTKAVMLRSSGVASACVLADTLYVAYNSTVSTLSTASDTTSPCSFTLPYATLGAAGRKSFDSLYFTGLIEGDLDITLRDQQDPDEPDRWTITASDLGTVQNKRIKLPRGVVGSKSSFKFETTGKLRVEEIRVVFDSGNRR